MSFEQVLALLVLLLLLTTMVRRLGRRTEHKTPADIERQAPEVPPPARARLPIPTPAGPWRRRVPEDAPVPAPQPTPPVRRRRARSRVGSLPEVRRGIVLMTILGPCRALEPPGLGRTIRAVH